MKNEMPYLDPPQRCDLLRRITAPYPDVDPEIVAVASLIKTISRSLSARMNNELASHELTEGKFYVLAFLHSEELAGRGNPGPSDIATHLDVTRGTITGLLDGLERDGYLIRCSDCSDRRALTIQITSKARDFLNSFLPKTGANITQALSLTEKEKHGLLETLSRIESSLHNREV